MSPANILFHAIPAWGHNKPIAALAVLITRARPHAIVTVITTGLIYPKLVKELKSKLSEEEYNLLIPRINVIDIAGSLNIIPFAPLKEFAPAYASLLNSEPLECKSSAKTFSGLPPPTVAILDPFAAYAFETILAFPGKKIPTISWLTSSAGALFGIFGPASLGGLTDPVLETEDGLKEARAWAISDSPEIRYDYKPPAPTVGYAKIKVPGYPPMYSHEWSPQINLVPDGKVKALGKIYTRASDGAITVSNSIYDKETMSALKGWLSSLGKTSFGMAPLSLPTPKKVSMNDAGPENLEVIEFLHRMKQRFGPKSLVYISFGTFFWPPEQKKLIVLIETLIENQTPFIFAHSSPLAANLSSELVKSIKSSETGMEMVWSPQETILQHDVTGWFITHGGFNSIQESFEHKVPLVFWPMGADQPANAATLSLTHKAAFELIEVRSGEEGTKPLLRFENTDYKPTFTVDAVKAEVEGLLKKFKGEEGRMVRENFEKLSNDMMGSWDDGKESRNELDRFLATYVD